MYFVFVFIIHIAPIQNLFFAEGDPSGKYNTANNLTVTIDLKEMDSVSLEFEPGSILALRATDVGTSRLSKKLGHLVNVNQRGYIAHLKIHSSLSAFLDGIRVIRLLGCSGGV